MSIDQSIRDGGTFRTVDLLVGTAIGMYVLIVAGITTGLVDAMTACHGWPICTGVGEGALADPTVALAMGHRLVAGIVGLLLFWTTLAVWRRRTAPKVRILVTLLAGVYPVQTGLGALTATASTSGSLSLAHLLTGMGIFTGVSLALLWHLEAEFPGSEGSSLAEPTATADVENGDESVAVVANGGTPAVREATSTTTQSAPNGMIRRAGAYLELMKPKLMWLLCLVAIAAMAMAGGRSLDPGLVVATLAGGVFAIGASGTFNNVLERDVDRRMDRTNDRPLVEGKISVWRAVAFGIGLTLASIGSFLAFVNPLAAVLGLLAILFYSVIYTRVLKPNTTKNIVIGGAVGAFPALIGWAAVTETVGVPALVLGAVIFLWTPAHFYNLAMAYREDYARADFPMLPVVAGEATTRRHILLYLVATMLGAAILGSQARLGWVYGVTVLLVGGLFLWTIVRQFREPTRPTVMRTFHTSNAYLGALLVAVVVDSILLL